MIKKGWTANMRFRYLSDARNFVHTLKLKNEQAWREYCKSGKKPKDIPSKPDFVYRGKGWIDWYDWLGIPKGFLSFTDAREYVRKLELLNQKAWREYCKSGKKPKDIPSTPDLVYRGTGWNGWPDFLGIRKKQKKIKIRRTPIAYVSYAEASAHAREKKIKTYSEWQKYCKSGKRPDNIPRHPERTYKGNGWTNWPDFLGTRNVAFYNREYVPFEEAKAYALGKKFQSRVQWEQHCTSGEKPDKVQE